MATKQFICSCLLDFNKMGDFIVHISDDHFSRESPDLMCCDLCFKVDRSTQLLLHFMNCHAIKMPEPAFEHYINHAILESQNERLMYGVPEGEEDVYNIHNTINAPQDTPPTTPENSPENSEEISIYGISEESSTSESDDICTLHGIR